MKAHIIRQQQLEVNRACRSGGIATGGRAYPFDGFGYLKLQYPANLARPHTHEGGLERFGGEPSTCEESALTGLPQVTVPGGFIGGGRYPVGVSLRGRLWTDGRMLALAYAYEQATHHRRHPSLK